MKRTASAQGLAQTSDGASCFQIWQGLSGLEKIPSTQSASSSGECLNHGSRTRTRNPAKPSALFLKVSKAIFYQDRIVRCEGQCPNILAMSAVPMNRTLVILTGGVIARQRAELPSTRHGADHRPERAGPWHSVRQPSGTARERHIRAAG